VSAKAVAKFGRPQSDAGRFLVKPEQFLFEKPVKIRGDYRSPLMLPVWRRLLE